MSELIISWKTTPGKPEQVNYFANDDAVGSGDAGFDKIIKILKDGPQIEKVTLKTSSMSGVGGESLAMSMPFGPRYKELKKIIGDRTLVID